MDNFFDFDSSTLSNHNKSMTEEEDADIDALNSETFGEDVPSSDWEETHAKLALELNQHHQNNDEEEQKDLSESIASFLFNDETEDVTTEDKSFGLPQQQFENNEQNKQSWWLNSAQRYHEEQATKNKSPVQNLWSGLPSGKPTMKFPSVDEIEKNMMREAALSNARKTFNNPNLFDANDLPSNPNMEQTGNRQQYDPGQSLLPSRDWENTYELQKQPYHAIHHPYAGPSNQRLSNPPHMHRMPPIRSPNIPPRQQGARPPQGALGPPRLQGSMCPVRSSTTGAIPRSHAAGSQQRSRGSVPRPPDGIPFNHRLLNDPRFVGPLGPRPNIPLPPCERYFFQRQPRFFNAVLRGPPPFQCPPGPQHYADEHAGLMSNQEKNFLYQIQMSQLQSSDPFQDDYYYMMKQQGNSGRKIVGTHSMKSNCDQGAAKPASTYTPQQFENSLGKLQVGSVSAPRKIIDMDLVENCENSSHRYSDRKSKQVLIEIENMFDMLVKLEASIMFPNPDKPMDSQGMQEKVINGLSAPGKLISVMSVKKGRVMVLRWLAHLKNPTKLIRRLVLDIIPISKKDKDDQQLLSLLPYIRMFISVCTLDELVEITDNYTDMSLLSTKFTISVMASIVERGEYLMRNNHLKVGEEVVGKYLKFLMRLAEATEQSRETDRPVVAVDHESLVNHLKCVLPDLVEEKYGKALINLLSNRRLPPGDKI